jgi:HSP20 family protein
MAKKKRPEPPISFGGLFKGLGNLIDLVSKLAEEGKELKKEFKGVTPTGKEFKGVYGFSIKSLAGGKPTVETFGNVVKETPKGPVVEEVREPMVDVFDEKDHIRVIAELPGVSKGNIDLEVKEDILKISAQRKERKYSKEVLLPSAVKKEKIESSYKNGILEIKLLKKAKKKK